MVITKNDTIPEEVILSKIYYIRGQKIMLDQDLAELYGVETKHLKRQVRRNKTRFPIDFMFELTMEELQNLRSQIGTSSWDYITCTNLPLRSRMGALQVLHFT